MEKVVELGQVDPNKTKMEGANPLHSQPSFTVGTLLNVTKAAAISLVRKRKQSVYGTTRNIAAGNMLDIHIAATNLDLEGLKLLQQTLPKEEVEDACQTFSPNDNGCLTLAITKAIRTVAAGLIERRIEVVDLLVEMGSPLDGAVVFAAWCGHVELILHILEKYKQVEVDGRVPKLCRNVDGIGNGETALHGLLFIGQKELVKTLITEYGADVNSPYQDSTYGGETVLHIACVQGDLEMVRFFVENTYSPANVNATINEGAEFFHSGKYDTFTYFGQTPLSFAACNGMVEIVRYLLDNKADITFQDYNNNTVFHLLALRSNRPAVERLSVLIALEEYVTRTSGPLEIERILNMPNKDGYTAIAVSAVAGS
jgi:hypothetical protein